MPVQTHSVMLQYRLPQNRCWRPSFCPLHNFKSICMCSDHTELEMMRCSMWKSGIMSSPDTPYEPQSPSVGRPGLFDWPADYSVCRAWLNSTLLHFPTTWISSLGLSPQHSRHQWSFIDASHRPFTLSSLPVIGEMSSTDVNITWVCESGFLQGARKWMKTSEPIMFCYSTPFKCSSLPFRIRRRLVRLIAGLTGYRSGAGCALVALQLHKLVYLCSG